MNLKRSGIILLYITAAFAVFLIGFFFGSRYSSSQRDGIRVVLKQEPTEPSATSAMTQSVPETDPAEPSVPETDPAEQSTAATEASQPADRSGKININTADPTQLVTLPGIGEVKARAIVAYRQEHGSFLTVDQIMEVSGIGPSTLEKIRDLITLE